MYISVNLTDKELYISQLISLTLSLSLSLSLSLKKRRKNILAINMR